MKNKVTCVCDLCSMGIPQSKQCYIGVRNCLKNGVYVEFRNREEEFKSNGKSDAKMSELPIGLVKMPTIFEQILTDECNKYVAKIGYDIKFNNREFAEMLSLYLNKPYKFHKLEKDMWVWDNEGGRYFKIFDTRIDGGNRFVVTNFSGFSSMLAYRPKRFYPREVK